MQDVSVGDNDTASSSSAADFNEAPSLLNRSELGQSGALDADLATVALPVAGMLMGAAPQQYSPPQLKPYVLVSCIFVSSLQDEHGS